MGFLQCFNYLYRMYHQTPPCHIRVDNFRSCDYTNYRHYSYHMHSRILDRTCHHCILERKKERKYVKRIFCLLFLKHFILHTNSKIKIYNIALKKHFVFLNDLNYKVLQNLISFIVIRLPCNRDYLIIVSVL